MFDELTTELLFSLIKNLAVPGNTGLELIALSVLIGLLIYRRRQK